MHSSFLRLGALVSLAAALVACNSNEPKPQAETKPTATASAEFNKPAEAAAPAKPAPEVKNPTVVSFEKMSVGLDNNAKELVGQVVNRAKSARKVVIVGFCDRTQVANPADAAVARAVAVRDELVRLGVPPATMLVKFDTKVAKKHAAEIRFD